MINKTLLNPYDYKSYKVIEMRIRHDKKNKNLREYKISMDANGDGLPKEVLLTTGYKDNDSDDNSFVLDRSAIETLINKLTQCKERLDKAEEIEYKLSDYHKALDKYLDDGYIEYINLEYRKNLLPPGFNPAIYKAFVIRPVFKKDIEIPSDVNTAFNFLEVLYLNPANTKEFDKEMDRIRHYNNIPIKFIGYNVHDEIEKRKKEAMKDLDAAAKRGYGAINPKDRSKYIKMAEDLGIPLNVLRRDKPNSIDNT